MVTEIESIALVKIYEFSRRKQFRLGFAEEKIGVNHSILESLNLQKLIFSKTKFGKLYWLLTSLGRQIAGKASRGQLVADISNTIPASLCKTCMNLGIIATPELIEKAKKMKETMGLYCCSDVEIHLLTKHDVNENAKR